MPLSFSKQEVSTGGDSSGVSVKYVKSSRTIHLFGWYDHFGGIEPEDVPLAQFLKALGITEADCRKAFAEIRESA